MRKVDEYELDHSHLQKKSHYPYDVIVTHVRTIKLELDLGMQEVYLANTKIGTPSSDPYSDQRQNRRRP